MTDETISFFGAVLATAALSIFGLLTWLDRRREQLSLVVDDPTDDLDEMVGEFCGMVPEREWKVGDSLVLPEAEPARTNLGFGRRNPHCSNCGDLRGGPFGHEGSECKYHAGMTSSEVAAILPEHQRDEFWDQQIDRYFAMQEEGTS